MNSPKLMTREIDKTHDGFSRVFKENLKDVSNSHMLSNDKSSTPRGLKVKEKIFLTLGISLFFIFSFFFIFLRGKNSCYHWGFHLVSFFNFCFTCPKN